MSTAFLISILAGALIASITSVDACTLRKVDVTPAGAENGDTYHGIASGVEVVFHNDVKDHPVTLFPEPPMTVRHLSPPNECMVRDGGVWGRDGVWVTDDGRTLVTTESSGSSEDLVFRDTSSCATVASVDVAGKRWRLDGRMLVLRDDRAPSVVGRRVRLDAACRPERPSWIRH